MATETVNPSAQPTNNQPRVSRLRWHNEALDKAACLIPAGTVMSVLDNVQDVARGIVTIMDILTFQSFADQDGEEDDQFIGLGDRESLMRLVAASAEMLVDQAWRTEDWAYEHHTPEGRALRRKIAQSVAQEEQHRG